MLMDEQVNANAEMAADYSALLKELKELRAENLKEHVTTRTSVQHLERSVSQVNESIETTNKRMEQNGVGDKPQ